MSDTLASYRNRLPSTPLAYDTVLARVLPPDWAAPLTAQEILTAEDLYEAAANGGATWFRHVVGLTQEQAQALMLWLMECGDDVGEVTARFFLPNFVPEHLKVESALNPDIAPFERLVVPQPLSGETGINRAPTVGCALEATCDREAISAWLLARATNPNTQAAYRKEAERFWAWCLFERQRALSDIKAGDAALYLRWLEGLGRTEPDAWSAHWRLPQADWVGPKNTPRTSPRWRPFNSPLSATSRHSAVVIVRQLYNFLKKTGYLIFNPFDQVSAKVPLLPGEGVPKAFSDRSLTENQWRVLEDHLDTLPEGYPQARLRVILLLGQGLGMRASEIAASQTQWVVERRVGLKMRTAIEILGKGGKVRRLPLTQRQVDVINESLAWRHLPVVTQCPPDTPLVVNLNRGRNPGGALSRSGVYRVLEGFFASAAEALATTHPADAAKLRAASTHWLRHTFAVEALSEMSVNVVQVAMGHASVATTGRYLNPDEEVISEALEKLDRKH